MRNVAHALLALICVTAAHAADSGADTITLTGNWFTNYVYSYGGSESARVGGLFGSDAEFVGLMYGNAQSRKIFQQSRTLSWSGAMCTVVGCAMVLVTVAVGNQQGEIRWPVVYAAALPVTLGLVLDFASAQRLKLAVSVFNADRRLRR
jgi:hypothetical protein